MIKTSLPFECPKFYTNLKGNLILKEPYKNTSAAKNDNVLEESGLKTSKMRVALGCNNLLVEFKLYDVRPPKSTSPL